MSPASIVLATTYTLLACLVAVLLVQCQEVRESFSGDEDGAHLVLAGTSGLYEPCPLLPLRRFQTADTERDVTQFQTDVVESVLRSIGKPDDSNARTETVTRMNTRPPCADPFLRHRWQSSEGESTPKKRLSNGRLYDSVHNTRSSVDTNGSQPHVSLLHAERLQPPPLSAVAMSTTSYANPFPEATTNSDGLHPTTAGTDTVTRALASEAGFQMQTDIPDSLSALHGQLAKLTSRLSGDVPYTRVRSCVARTCRPSQLYVFRDVYYRAGSTHGFQVDWTVVLLSDNDTENDHAEASLVDGRVVGTYLPGADFYPGELVENIPLAHAESGTIMYIRSLPYAEVRP